MLRTERLYDALRGRGKSLMYAGTALAMTGTGAACMAAGGGSAPVQLAGPRTTTVAEAAPQAPAGYQNAQLDDIVLAAHRGPRTPTWKQVRDQLNRQTNPVAAAHGRLPLADRLLPLHTSGPQAWMPISAARLANATTIVRRALAKRMGIRSAVVAVATSMQEATLLNLDYGDSDSLGLFQQRPSCGWGSAAEITDPGYAADAFLSALHQHQASDPSWAAQPLWANAQAVQNSGFPYAYAKWETQAARLVAAIATRIR